MSYLAKMPEGLLPCPHCGGEAEVRDGSSTTPYIRCKSCGCRTGSSRDMDRLKETWNRRAERTCEPVEIFEEEVFGLGIYRECSECHETLGRETWPNYCPHCGARIIEEDE